MPCTILADMMNEGNTPKRFYGSMFDQVWSFNRRGLQACLIEIICTGCLNDPDAYGKPLRMSTSRQYLNDWTKRTIQLLDMTSQQALYEMADLNGISYDQLDEYKATIQHCYETSTPNTTA